MNNKIKGNVYAFLQLTLHPGMISKDFTTWPEVYRCDKNDIPPNALPVILSGQYKAGMT
jgi:hypothetical protein